MSLSSSQSHAADLQNAHISPAQTASSSSPPPFPVSLNRTPVTVIATNSFPTPASSICGRAANINSMDEGDGSSGNMNMLPAHVGLDDGDGQYHHNHNDSNSNKNNKNNNNSLNNPLEQPDDPMDCDTDSYPAQNKRPTNHDRQGPSPQQSPQLPHGQPPSPPQPQSHSDSQAQPQPQSSGPAPFTAEFGKTFNLCKRNYQNRGPNVSIDLISLYGLGPVARTVARNDLITGEKINRLRKSYEGKIKPLGLAGRNKPVRVEKGQPNRLLDMLAFPDDEWHNQNVFGKEIRVPEPDSAQHRLLLKATKCEPGYLPNASMWEDLLGHDKGGGKVDNRVAGDSLRRSVSVTDATRRESNGTPVSAVNSAAPSPSFAQSEYASSRPKRTGKKRSYHDNTFSGYGEGFVDDDGDNESVYDDDGKSKKKRRKASSPLAYPPDRGGSYGVGMFGYGAR